MKIEARVSIRTENVFILLSSIVDALRTAHLSGYLHNDIKLDNVVIRGNKETMIPLLIDFNKS